MLGARILVLCTSKTDYKGLREGAREVSMGPACTAPGSSLLAIFSSKRTVRVICTQKRHCDLCSLAV